MRILTLACAARWVCCGEATTGTKPKRRVVLLSPGDRYNFGDLLFEKVARKLLCDRKGYLTSDLVSAGVISANMSRYGGSPSIHSIRDVIRMSRAQVSIGKGPFDLVNLGGEAAGCCVGTCGADTFWEDERRSNALQNPSACSYIIPKSILLPIGWKALVTTPSPVSIINSIGGNLATCCFDAVATADYGQFRDRQILDDARFANRSRPFTLAPDSAVMVDALYRDTITSYAEKGEVARIIRATKGCYVAMQFNALLVGIQRNRAPDWSLGNWSSLVIVLDTAHRITGCTVVLFCAGTALFHDSFDVYHHLVAKAPHVPVQILKSEHVWSVVALVSRAHLVISTSMHVRIMAFIHKRPRVFLSCGDKHEKFVSMWEAPTAAGCVELSQNPRKLFTQALVHEKQHAIETQKAVKFAVAEYLKSFELWSSLLNQ